MKTITISDDIHYRIKAVCAVYKMKVNDFTALALTKLLEGYQLPDIGINAASGERVE